MGKQIDSVYTIPERTLEAGSDKKTSEVKGSGRFFFALAKIIVDLIFFPPEIIPYFIGWIKEDGF